MGIYGDYMKKNVLDIRKGKCILLGLLIVTGLMFGALSARADDYGDAAYSHLQHIDASYPQRWSGTENNARMREWLVSTVTSFGYTPELTYAEGTSPYGWGDYSGYNITFYKPGQSAQEVVVCAHYDSVSTNGCEDNGTGVSVLLELAQRFVSVDTRYTIRFILFDIEEPGCLGSAYYVNHQDISNVIAVINMDSVGVGDDLYVYGGDYEDGVFVRGWVLAQALETAEYTGVNLKTVPSDYEGTNVVPPAKTGGSDHAPFNDMDIPYIYLASSYWTKSADTGLQQVSDPSIPNGKIMHVAEYDNYAFLTGYFGNRMREHMSQCSKLVTYMLLYMNADIGAEQMFPEPTATPTPVPTATPVPETTEVVTEPETEAETILDVTEVSTEYDSDDITKDTTDYVSQNQEDESQQNAEELPEASIETEMELSEDHQAGGLADNTVWIAVVCVLFAGVVCAGVLTVNRRRR